MTIISFKRKKNNEKGEKGKSGEKKKTFLKKKDRKQGHNRGHE